MTVKFLSVSANRKPADLFIAGCFEDEPVSKELLRLEPSLQEIVKSAKEKNRISGKFGEIFSTYHSGFKEAPEIILFGLGKRKNHQKRCMRKTAGMLYQQAQKLKAVRVRILLDSFTSPEVRLQEAAGIVSEISSMAAYAFDRYKTKTAENKDKKNPEVEILILQKTAEAGAEKASTYALAVAEGVNFARDLINEPGNIMHPQQLALEAKKMAARKKIHCEILDLAELKRLKMNGILAVNQGSCIPPALIILEHGKSHKSKGTVCLVGKGVTFDTGGISIKPSKDMEKMKYDMSGAAAVIGAMSAIADLKLPIHVVGLAPAVENNVAEDPQRPGDIIRMYNGKTVEVLNTDAEGRLILGDALAYSEKYKPKAIIDLATLTGMCAYTFGNKAIAVLGNDNKLLDRVKKAGEETGERCWELPLWDDYAESIKGHHSDLYNIGGPYGGTITAAMFLKEFVPEKTAWAHLDIAGTAWADSARYDCPKGATGVGVRLLVRMLSQWSGKA